MNMLDEAPLAAGDASTLGESWPDETLGNWFVLRTRGRQEKNPRARPARPRHRLLSAAGDVHEFYGGRRVRVELPLFPGYVFLRGDLVEAYQADRTRRIAQIIRVPDQRRMDQELRSIHIALGADATLDSFPSLRTGVRVEVREGPFRGLQGMVQDRTRLDRLILHVETLGQAVSLEIDGSLLDLT